MESWCCPKCKKLDVSLDTSTGEIECLNPSCRYIGKKSTIDLNEKWDEFNDRKQAKFASQQEKIDEINRYYSNL